MATYMGPVCPSFESTLEAIKSAEQNMSEYSSNFQSQINQNDGELTADELMFSSSGLGIIVETEIPPEVRGLYERIFYSMLSPTFTDPEVFDPAGELDYITALNDGNIDPEEAAIKAAKIALAQAVAIYNATAPFFATSESPGS